MANNTIISEKRKALLAHKEKILVELKYYEKRIQDEQSKTKIEYYLDDASSDSDDDFTITTDLGGPSSIMQLKMEQSKLRTCLQATQELTNLQILQSEVNVIVKEPVLTRESPVTEPGTWREVTAECRIDLIPFSITFYMHKSNGKFGPKSYRGLQVMLVKAAHEAELSQSILPIIVRPSDAVEVLRSYAEAYRSRRSTLARLATKYADSLYMEPMAEGGYLLKCANLLQVAWRLENKWSPLARFHHRMKFDLEYMEEKYINTITDSHKQLSDPTISTDERTLLLSKIIATCLEAKPVSESAESEQETRLPKRRATLDQEIEEPDSKKKKEVMAPPKSLPKKAKVSKTVADKPKSSNNPNKTKTSAVTGEGDKENVDINLHANNKNVEKSVAAGSDNGQKQAEKASKTVNSTKHAVESSKDKVTDKNNKEAEPKNKKTETVPRNKNPDTQSDNIEQLSEKPPANKKSKVKDNNKKVTNSNNAEAGTNKRPAKNLGEAKNVETNKEPSTITNNKNKNSKEVAVDKNSNVAVQGGKASGKKNKVKDGGGFQSKNDNSNAIKKTNSDTAVVKTNKKLSKENTDVNIIPKNVQTSETKRKLVPKATEKVKNSETANRVVEKNIANAKNKDKIVDIAKKASTKSVANSKEKVNDANKNKDTENKEITVKPNREPAKVKKSIETKKVTEKKSISNDKKKPTNIMNVTITKEPSDKGKLSNPNSKTSEGNINNYDKNVKSTGQTKKSVLPLRMHNNFKILRKSIGNITKGTHKNIVAKENGVVKSKIPQKKLSPLNEKFMKNPLRMSPRHLASTFNSTSSSVSKPSIQKSTNIPRLTKPMFKAK